MKKYIGTKQIEAEPMTMGEAFEKGLLKAGRVPNESEKSNAGYHVKYQDGYESWSPAEPFEKAYKICDTFMNRLQIELSELSDKQEKLGKFLVRICSKDCQRKSKYCYVHNSERWKLIGKSLLSASVLRESQNETVASNINTSVLW